MNSATATSTALASMAPCQELMAAMAESNPVERPMPRPKLAALVAIAVEISRPANQSVTTLSGWVVSTAPPMPPTSRATTITAYDSAAATVSAETSTSVRAIAMVMRSPRRAASMPPGSATNTPGSMNRPSSTPICA